MKTRKLVEEFAEEHGVEVTVMTYSFIRSSRAYPLEDTICVFVEEASVDEDVGEDGGWQSRSTYIPYQSDPTEAVRELLQGWVDDHDPDKLVECPACCGEGGGEYDTTDHVYEHTTRPYVCGECDGEGSIERWRAKAIEA